MAKNTLNQIVNFVANPLQLNSRQRKIFKEKIKRNKRHISFLFNNSFSRILNLRKKYTIKEGGKVYSISKKDFLKMIRKHPRFCDLVPEHVLNKSKKYGFKKSEFLEILISYPRFAGRDPKTIIKKAKQYGFTKEKFLEIIKQRPSITGLDAKEVMKKSRIYGFTKDEFLKIIKKKPRFAELDPKYVLRKRKEYGFSKPQFLKIIKDFPGIAGVDPKFILNKRKEYGFSKKEFIKIIKQYPEIIGRDPKYIIKKKERYGFTKKEFIEIIKKFPPIIGYDPKTVINKFKIYGITNKSIIRKRLNMWPQFICLDHNRILKINLRLGHLFGLENKFIKKISFKYMFFNSANPYKKIAMVDVLKGFNSTLLDSKIAKKYRKKFGKEIKSKKLLEIKADIICSWFNGKTTWKKYSPFIRWKELPLNLRKKYKKVFKPIYKKHNNKVDGIRESVAKKHNVNKESRLKKAWKKRRLHLKGRIVK